MAKRLRYAWIAAGLGAAAMGGATTHGQAPSAHASETRAATVAETTLTFQRHDLLAGASAGNLEGASCPADFLMIAGSCHPGYDDQLVIINQFPNRFSNTWRCGFKNNSRVTRSVWIYTLCARPSDVDTVVHPLEVRRYITTTLTNADADAILADATTVLQTNDGPGDVACDVVMEREGSVTSFSTGDGSIDSSVEFTAIIGLPGEVKAVNQINWCGGLIPNVIGCAPVPGNSLAIVRFTASLEGILWAHEFGHNKGLSHRNDDPNAVMNGTIGATRRRVSAAECDAFRALPATGPTSGVLLTQRRASDQMGVEDFVRQVFIQGVPYEEARAFGPAAVPTLLDMLNDPAEEAHWANVVVTIGMIGDDRAVGPLINFVNADAPGQLSRAHYTAKTSAIMSLGYIVNQTGNQEALDYLAASVSPQTWARSNVGVAPFQTSTDERDYDFSKYAILGLALSGRPEAAAVLRALEQPGVTESDQQFRAQVSDLVADALVEHERVSTQGLADYYRTRRP